MYTIPGYTMGDTLQQSTAFTLRRARRDNDLAPVLLLSPAEEPPPGEVSAWLEHAYALRSELDPAWSAQPLALLRDCGHLALVLADPGGVPLERLLGRPLDSAAFLPLAIGLADAVGQMHAHGLLHKDIKPANVLVDPDRGLVRLTGFGLASRVPREMQPAAPVEIITGSFAYMAPEQTGRMNRSVDARSDLYALGVSFYQMLTGALPFSASDPMEWIHCHIAGQPRAPDQRVATIPAQLAAIVMKLLAKGAEERYQTAAGLAADLRRCADMLATGGRIVPFPLASRDMSDRLQVPEKLYGRTSELDTLRDAWEHVLRNGALELVLVSGYSGIGKSALVNELHQALVEPRGIFIAGKFEQYKRDIPYATLAQAFQPLIRQILAQGDSEVARWREAILAALGPNGQVVVRLMPELEWLIGPQPAVPELPPTEAQNRFHALFRQFLNVFARAEHPLLLFLDDLQWLDVASLTLLDHLITAPDVRHLLLIGAYRDNEVGPAHPLMLTLDAIRKSGTPVHDIVLAPLSSGDVRQLVADTLSCDQETANALSRLVYQRTEGNPFFTIQFLTALAEQRLLKFVPGQAAWRWDVARIEAQPLADNVVELMVAKLQRLPAATRETLKQLACLGNSASLALIALVRDSVEERVQRDLWEAVRSGLLLNRAGSYRFLHDRIQEAAYTLIPEPDRAAIHLAIGRLLYANLSAAEREERVFEVVNQFNRGLALVTDPDERAALARLNFLAGKRAKAAIAYASARNYLDTAAGLLAPGRQAEQDGASFELQLELGECEYLAGNFERADELLKGLLAHARRDTDKARVYRLRMRLYQVAGRYDDAVDAVLEALQLFGVPFPEDDEQIMATFNAEHAAIESNRGGRPIAELIDAPPATDPAVRAIIGLLVESIACVYIARSKIFPLVIMKAVNFSLRHGNMEESCFAYSGYGIILVAAFGDIPSAYAYSDMAMRLNERYGDAKLKGTLLYVHGAFINFWRHHITTSAPIMARSFLASQNVGDLVYAGYNGCHTTWHVVERGDPLDEVLQCAHQYMAFARQSRSDVVYQTLRIYEQFVACMQGRTLAPTSFDQQGCKESDLLDVLGAANFTCGIAFFHIAKLVAAVILGRHDEALRSAQLAGNLLREVIAMTFEATYHFYHALTLAALWPEAPAELRAAYRTALDEKLVKLKLWADNCPENYLNRWLLVSAEVAVIDGAPFEAVLRLYEDAIASAYENGFAQNEALANELAGRFCLARGFTTIGMGYLGKARNGYARWGALGKVRQLDERHPALPAHEAGANFGGHAGQLDLMTVVKASQAVSGEIVLNKVIETLLSIVLEHAGAERGLLILAPNAERHTEAEAVFGGEQHSCVVREQAGLSTECPQAVLQYVIRTGEQVILDDAHSSRLFGADDYVRRVRLKSVLCMPLVKQTKLVGLLYLENKLTSRAFTPSRIALLELLASQAAISLENATLYAELQREEYAIRELNETLESRVRERSAALEHANASLSDALASLQHAQHDLIAAEKMASLGALVAGIAHELNTPIGNSLLVASTLHHRMTEMELAAREGSMKRSTLLEYLSDTNRACTLMEGALGKAANLIASFKQVAVDQTSDQRRVFDLQLVLRNTLATFAPRFKLDGCRASLDVPDGLNLDSFPGSIGQIMNNLITNALVHAFDGRPSGRIRISAREEDGDWIRIAFQDDGGGMPPEVLRHVFDPFFTTKMGQGGTGLGMNIVYNIVTGVLGGRITVESAPGMGTSVMISVPRIAPVRERTEKSCMQVYDDGIH